MVLLWAHTFSGLQFTWKPHSLNSTFLVVSGRIIINMKMYKELVRIFYNEAWNEWELKE